MKNEQIKNIHNLIARAAQSKTSMDPELIAKNLGKMQRIASDLPKRYLHSIPGEVSKARRLEDRAVSLGAELGLEVYPSHTGIGAPLKIIIDAIEYGVF